MKIIENFNWHFFAKKRTVQQEAIEKLIACLVPICGDLFLGSKALDIISKLTTSDYFKDFSMVCKTFTRFQPDLLKKMHLNEYLTKKRFCDSQLQAYALCKIIEENLGKVVLFEIVRIK